MKHFLPCNKLPSRTTSRTIALNNLWPASRRRRRRRKQMVSPHTRTTIGNIPSFPIIHGSLFPSSKWSQIDILSLLSPPLGREPDFESPPASSKKRLLLLSSKSSSSSLVLSLSSSSSFGHIFPRVVRFSILFLFALTYNAVLFQSRKSVVFFPQKTSTSR